MPLTACLADASIVDATACSDDVWASVYRTELTLQLTCRGCGHPMMAKRSSKGLRFFAHRAAGPADCPSAGESAEHLELKRRLADLIRLTGAEAILEATPAQGDQGGWRADVLCIAPSGRRVAFEVQLAAMTVEEGNERSSKYRRDGIDVAWVTSKHAHWVSRIPSMRIDYDDTGAWVTRGIAKFGAMYGWTQPEPVPLDRVVRGLVEATIEPVSARSHEEDVGGKTRWISDATLLVPSAEARAVEQARARAEAQRALEQDQRAQHERNVRALMERQERVLQIAIDDALSTGISENQVWLGVPATWWNGARPVPVMQALGNPRTAMGLAVWVGPNSKEVRLWAVICPVAGRCTSGLGWSWAKRDVRVYAETMTEAAKLAQALNRRPSGILVRETSVMNHNSAASLKAGPEA